MIAMLSLMLICIWVLWTSLVQTWHDCRYCWNLLLNTYLKMTLILTKSQRGVESKQFYTSYFVKFFMDMDGIGRAVEAWWFSIKHSFYFVLISMKGHEPSFHVSIQKTLMLACIQTFTDWSFSNLVWWQTLLNCVFWYGFGWPWPSFKVKVLWEIETILHSKSHDFLSWFWWNVVCSLLP